MQAEPDTLRPPADAETAGARLERAGGIRFATPAAAHATVWRSKAGFLAARTVVRLRRDDGGYAVERRDVSGDGSWRPPSRIVRAYRVVDGALAPTP